MSGPGIRVELILDQLVKLQPGDALVLRGPVGMTLQELDWCRRRVEAALGTDVKFLIVDGSWDVPAVLRADEPSPRDELATADLATREELLLDPDCAAGKHQSCVGGPCRCACHQDWLDAARKRVPL